MKVVLIGDSIRMGYQPLVTRKLQNEAEVWGPKENCCYGIWTLAHFDAWVRDQDPDIVHANFGIHDVSRMPDGQSQILLEQYKLSVRRFIERIKSLDKARMIWATMTPLYIPRKDLPMTQWEPRPEPIAEYNAAAVSIMKEHGIPVNDLHQLVIQHGFHKCQVMDGCHMDAYGNEVLSDAVVRAVRALNSRRRAAKRT